MSNIILLVAFFSCHSHVLLHDAMLARYMPWPCVRVRVRVRLSVRCVLQVGVMSKRQNEFSRVLALELPSTYPPLCYKEIRIPCPNSGTRQFCHGKSIMSSTKLSTVEFVDHTYDGRDESLFDAHRIVGRL